MYRVLGNFGLVGTALFLTIYGSLLVNTLHNYLRWEEPVNLGVFTALISFPLSVIGPSNAFIMELSWILFGVALAAARLGSNSHQ